MLIETKKNREDYFESCGNCSDVQRIKNEWKHLWRMKMPSKIKVFCWMKVLVWFWLIDETYLD